MKKNINKIFASIATLLCFGLAGCGTTNDSSSGGDSSSGQEYDWRDNMNREENDFLEDDNRRPGREPFVDDAPDDDGELKPYRFEAENAKIKGNSASLDHFCTGKSLEFSRSFSGNLALCNLGTSTLSFTVESDKKVRSDISFRIANQYSKDTNGVFVAYADVKVNGKPVVDLSKAFDVESGEVADGCSSSYFNMVTVDTKISLFEGKNTIEITPASSNYLNLDYIEINTSAAIKDLTQSTLTDADRFVRVPTKPTATAKGKIAFDCQLIASGKDCNNANQRGRTLPALSDEIYTKETLENGEVYTIPMLKGKVAIVKNLTYTLTLSGGATFDDGSTTKKLFEGDKPSINVAVPEGKALSGWKDQDGDEYPVTFVMPDKDVTLTPIFADANATITLKGGKIDGKTTFNSSVGAEFDLTSATADQTPEGKVLKGWSTLENRTALYTDSYTVESSVTLVPVFDSTSFMEKTEKVGKIQQTGNLYIGKFKDCYNVTPNKTVGAVDTGDNHYEVGSIYHMKGGTAEAPKDTLAVGSYFLSQEMNGTGLYQGPVEEGRIVTSRVENFSSEDLTMRFALIKSSGDPKSHYSEHVVTIPAHEAITFTDEITYLHNSFMLNMMVQDHAVNEVFIGVYQYISAK